MITSGNLIGAFLAGLTSFFAPCLLPLFPSYFSAVSGFTFAQLYGLDFGKIRLRVFVSSLFFSAGFAIVFTALGATGSLVGQLLEKYLPYLLRLSGIFLILLGLVQLGIIKIPSFEFDYAWKMQKKMAGLGFLTSLVTGIAAALSWIPCIGPLLSPILLLSAESETVFSGSLLLFIFSLGLTVPFLAGGLFFPAVVNLLQGHRQLFHRISQLAGIFIIILGILLLADKYQLLIKLFEGIVLSVIASPDVTSGRGNLGWDCFASLTMTYKHKFII